MEQWVEKLWKQESARSLPTLVLTEVMLVVVLFPDWEGTILQELRHRPSQTITRQHPRVEDERAA